MIKKIKLKLKSQRKIPKNLLMPGTLLGIIYLLYRQENQYLIIIFFMLLIMLALLALQLFIVKKKVDVKLVQIDEQYSKNELFEIKLRIINRSMLPSPYIYIYLDKDERLQAEGEEIVCVTLDGQSQTEVSLKYRGIFAGRGTVKIGLCLLVDLFEVFRKKLKINQQTEAIILPVLKTLENSKPLISSLENSKNIVNVAQDIRNQRFNNGDVGYDLEPYQPGESERLIHWKIVAQKNQYLVRERDALEDKKETFILILDYIRLQNMSLEQSIRLEDKTMSAFISIAKEILETNKKLYMIYHTDRWNCHYVEQVHQLEKVISEVAYCKFIAKQDITLEERLPITTLLEPRMKSYPKLLIAQRTDIDIREFISKSLEGRSVPIQILETGMMSYGDEDEQTVLWHLDDEYRIKRNI